jgi:hypothetical protein
MELLHFPLKMCRVLDSSILPISCSLVLLPLSSLYATTDRIFRLRNDFVQLIRKEPSPKIVCLTELKALKPLSKPKKIAY